MGKKVAKEDPRAETSEVTDIATEAEAPVRSAKRKSVKASSEAKTGSVSRSATVQKTSGRSAASAKLPSAKTAVTRAAKKPAGAANARLAGVRKTRMPSAKTALRLLIGSVDKLLASKNSAFQQSEQGQTTRLAASMERIKLQTSKYESAKAAAIRAHDPA